MDPLSRRSFIGGAAAVTAAVTAPVAEAKLRSGRGSTPAPTPTSTPTKVKTAAQLRLPNPKGIEASDPADLALLGVASLLQAGLLSSVELTTALLERAGQRDGATTAWRRVYPDYAMQLARAADAQLASARRTGANISLVTGVPLALKDLYAVEGFEVTASSKVLAGNVATGDSTVWANLKAAGMVLLGHAETDEFAIGVGTAQTGNPWNPDYSPGGSSGGSGSLLGARLIPAATGTDTGGSLRLPATACGITSIKPTFGRVSAHGVIVLQWGRDHCGAMGRAAGDASLLLSYMAGPDQADPSTLTAPVIAEESYPTFPRPGSQPLAGMRFGVVSGDESGLPAATGKIFSRFLGEIQSLGGVLVDVTLPDLPGASNPAQSESDLTETGVYHSQFLPGSTGKYRTEYQALITGAISAANALSVDDYLGYQQDRVRFCHNYNALFEANNLTAILVPGSSADGGKRNELAGTTFLSGSVPGDVAWANLAGVPVVCTPAGLSDATGLPFGVQIGARAWEELKVLQIAIDYQHHYPYWAVAPKPLMTARTLTTAEYQTPPASSKPDPTNTVATRPAVAFTPTLLAAAN